MMSFIWPLMLFSLLLVPLFVLLYLRIQQRRRQVAADYGGFGLVQAAGGNSVGWRRHVPPLLFLLGLTLLLVAAARPEAVVNLPRVEGTVILAFDVSGSMAADDLEPTRMEAAKNAARIFIELQPNTIQIGVVAFSDGGFMVQAPTNDPESILTTIDRLSPERGTSLGHGILTALNTIAADTDQTAAIDLEATQEPVATPTPLPEGTFTPAVIVLLTDGENLDEPDPLEAAQIAAARGVRIHTVGIGSAAGAALEIDGFTVFTRLDEAMLQQIARITGGTYFNAENEEDLQTVYENLDPQLVIKAEKMEVTSIFAGASLLMLLVGGAFSLLWFGRLP